MARGRGVLLRRSQRHLEVHVLQIDPTSGQFTVTKFIIIFVKVQKHQPQRVVTLQNQDNQDHFLNCTGILPALQALQIEIFHRRC